MSIHDHAYVIAATPYQESSALVRLLTLEHGLVSAVVRGVYKTNKQSSAMRAALQQGNLVECYWSGRSNLKTAYKIELIASAGLDTAGKLVCLAYAHELLLYFSKDGLCQQEVFILYRQLLKGISDGKVEDSLRVFEFGLLESLGYGIDFGTDFSNNMPVEPGLYYQLVPGSGVRWAGMADIGSISGEHLLAIRMYEFTDPTVLRIAKRVTRQLLSFHMEGKPIKTRQMYRDLFGQK